MNKTRSLIPRFLPVLLWMLAIFLLSEINDPDLLLRQLLPGSAAATPPPAAPAAARPESLLDVLRGAQANTDRSGWLGHLAEFAILGCLITRALVWRSRGTPALLLAAWGLTFLYGLTDEVHQVFVPGRSFEYFDLWMDLAGAALGVGAYLFFRDQPSAGREPQKG